MGVDLNQIIRMFSMFLNNSWNIVIPLLRNRSYTTDESSINDWIQSNWEILVERKILEINNYLEVYGSGADFNEESSRITDIKALPTYFISVFVEEAEDILNKEQIKNKEYNFEKLVGCKDCCYIDAPPFDFVFIEDEEKERVFSLNKVELKVKKVENKDIIIK